MEENPEFIHEEKEVIVVLVVEHDGGKDGWRADRVPAAVGTSARLWETTTRPGKGDHDSREDAEEASAAKRAGDGWGASWGSDKA